MQAIEHELRRFVIDNFLYGQDGHLSNEASFLEEGIIDSTGVLELVSFLEEKYGIEVQDREMVPENLDSIHRLAVFLQRKLGSEPQGVEYAGRRVS
jgi:acyl carrier protein